MRQYNNRRIAALRAVGDIEREAMREQIRFSTPTPHAALLSYVGEKGTVRTGDVAREFGVSVPTASTRLSRALVAGLLHVAFRGDLEARVYSLNLKDDLGFPGGE